MYSMRIVAKSGKSEKGQTQVNSGISDLHFAKRVYVKLKTLELDTAFVGDVFNADRGKVRKIRERADTGKFWDFKFDFDLAPGKLIGECIQGIEVHLCPWSRCNLKVLLINR